MPFSPTQDEVGPITRTVEDAARMLDVMAGHDPCDPITARGIGRVPASVRGSIVGSRAGGCQDRAARRRFWEPGSSIPRSTTWSGLAVAQLMRLGAVVMPVGIPGWTR